MKVPGFSDIGKQTKELLYGGKGGVFQFDQKLKVTKKTSDGVTFALSSAKKGDGVEADVKTTYNFDPYSVEVTANHTGKVGLKATVSDLLTPGLKCTASVPLPMSSPAKLSVGYVRPYLNTTANVELAASPKVDASMATGHGNVVVGGDCSYDTSKGDLSKWALGAGYSVPEYNVGLLWADKGDTVKAMYSHKLNDGVAGAEIVKSFKGEGSTKFTLGMSHPTNSGANVKYKFDSAGVLSVLWEQSLDKSTKIGLSTQTNVKDIEKGAKLGVSLEMN
ncbi:hypothetical protein BSKO_00844 [Bryopsis sp. KO-2023]|nr:hypothetical protein BSKO_00844 [Bryopsis sp. KO-2023]